MKLILCKCTTKVDQVTVVMERIKWKFFPIKLSGGRMEKV